jgi:hypothetical protein
MEKRFSKSKQTQKTYNYELIENKLSLPVPFHYTFSISSHKHECGQNYNFFQPSQLIATDSKFRNKTFSFERTLNKC